MVSATTASVECLPERRCSRLPHEVRALSYKLRGDKDAGHRACFGAFEAGSQEFPLPRREAVEATGEREQLSFERDIRPLFRERDRSSMLNVAQFDLWERDDVAERSGEILERLENGSMPCDEAWPEERVALFRRWVDAGRPA
jgi:hypothetical protein